MNIGKQYWIFYQIRQLLIHIFSLHHCLMRVLYLDYEKLFNHEIDC
jgi:hypothetical protein